MSYNPSEYTYGVSDDEERGIVLSVEDDTLYIEWTGPIEDLPLAYEIISNTED